MGATRRGARSYRDLIAWQRAFQLADRCLDVADHLSSRHGALANQIRRSAVSVVSNIAEGNGDSRYQTTSATSESLTPR